MLKYLFLIAICIVLLSSCSEDSPTEPQKKYGSYIIPIAKGYSLLHRYTGYHRDGTVKDVGEARVTILDTMSYKLNGKDILLYLSQDGNYKSGRFEDEKSYYSFSIDEKNRFSYYKDIDKQVYINQIIPYPNFNGTPSSQQRKILDLNTMVMYKGKSLPCIKIETTDKADTIFRVKRYSYHSNSYGPLLEERFKLDTITKKYFLYRRAELIDATIK